MDENQTTLERVADAVNPEPTAPEAILQAQINELTQKVKQLNSELAYAKVEATNKDIELASLKALVDSQTKAAPVKEEYVEMVDENDLSAALMKGDY